METRYHIWEAMVALQDMCAGSYQGGVAYALGSFHIPSQMRKAEEANCRRTTRKGHRRTLARRQLDDIDRLGN